MIHALRHRQTVRPVPARRARGFTLIELLVVVTITGVLLTLALPSFQDVILTNKLASYANNFSASVQLARGEAIKRNAPTTICRSSSGTSCISSGNFQQGWIVFADVNGNGAVDAGDAVLQYQQALSNDYSMTATAYTLTFLPSGVGSTASTLSLCRALPTVGAKKRTITLSLVGRVSVATASTTSCP